MPSELDSVRTAGEGACELGVYLGQYAHGPEVGEVGYTPQDLAQQALGATGGFTVRLC